LADSRPGLILPGFTAKDRRRVCRYAAYGVADLSKKLVACLVFTVLDRGCVHHGASWTIIRHLDLFSADRSKRYFFKRVRFVIGPTVLSACSCNTDLSENVSKVRKLSILDFF